MSQDKDWILVSWNQDGEGRRSWQGDITDVASPTTDIEQHSDDKAKEITKKHWINNEERAACSNRECRMKFSLIDRPHHCRRCGEIFCNTCVKFQRKLNFLASPDPNGRSYKVCRPCFEEGRDSEGLCRNLTAEFQQLKRQGWETKFREQHANSRATVSWRDKLDLEREITRLVQGFRKSVGSSEMKRTITEMKTVLKTPSWQKATYWIQENMSEQCNACHESFGLMRKKLNCKVCALVLCKACCHRELLVYVPDDHDPTAPPDPQIAIIKIVGSPEVEPEISVLLHVCDSCKQKLIDRQVAKVEQGLEVNDPSQGPVSKLEQVDRTVSELQDKILNQLLKYQSIIKSLEDGRRHSEQTGSNTKTLAKAQEDLSDFLAMYVLKVQLLKKMLSLPETDTQTTLFRNYLKAKSVFYLDNMYTYRCMKRKLADSAPVEVLEHIQRVVDQHAIVSVQLYVRQLIFETLHLCDRYSLEETIPCCLTPVDRVVEEEAQQCLVKCGEDWEEHVQNLKTMIRSQIKERRLVRPSRTCLARQGAKHAADIMLRRSQEVIDKVNVQLAMKAANRSFPATKKALATAQEETKRISEIAKKK